MVKHCPSLQTNKKSETKRRRFSQAQTELQIIKIQMFTYIAKKSHYLLKKEINEILIILILHLNLGKNRNHLSQKHARSTCKSEIPDISRS